MPLAPGLANAAPGMCDPVCLHLRLLLKEYKAHHKPQQLMLILMPAARFWDVAADVQGTQCKLGSHLVTSGHEQ